MTPLQTLRLHLNEYERFIQRATEMEAGIREEESGVVISNAYWETAYEAVFGTSKDVHSLGAGVEYPFGVLRSRHDVRRRRARLCGCAA